VSALLLRTPPRGAAVLGAVAALLLSACGGGSKGGGGPAGETAPVLHLAFAPIPDGDVDPAHTVTVTVLDAAGHVAPAFAATVTLSLAAGSAGAVLGGLLTAVPDHGVAVFSVTLRKPGGGYALRAEAPGASPGQSAPFALAPGAPAALAFSAQPADAVAGAALAEVAVRIDDAWGNATASTATIDLSAAAGSPGPLQGSVSGAATAGVARFPAVRIEVAGAYALRATSGALTPGTSTGFKIAPAAPAALRIGAVPGGAVAGEPFQVVSHIVDAFGNATTATGIVVEATLSPAFAPLLGTTSVTSVGGVATFAALAVERARSSAAVSVSAEGLAAATSAPFDVAAAAASGLAFGTQPAGGVAGVALGAVTLAVEDLYGNLRADSVAPISVALQPPGPTLLGTITRNASAGVATFVDLSLARAGTGYTLRASSPALADAVSAPFSITAGAGAALAFTAGPQDVVAGATLAEVAVASVDAYGNTIADAAADVTIALDGAPLIGTTQATPVGGVARFVDLSVQRAGTGYRLSAAAGSLHGNSVPFAVTPAAANHLAFSTQPTATAVGVAITPPVAVEVRDAFENLVDAAVAVAVTVASTTAPGGALAGTISRASIGGVATFGDLHPTAVGTYALGAASEGLAPATSASFDATAPSAALVYTAPVGGRIALRLSPASTVTTAVLELVAVQPFAGYSVAMNLPIDATRVSEGAPLFTPGEALALGSGVVAAGAALPVTGPLAGVVVSGASQKAFGGGAVATDADVHAGAVLYTVRLDTWPQAAPGVVFDGATLSGDARFRAAVRDRLGNEVVAASDFAIGKLEVVVR
jgi:hypothetical protein